MANRIVNLYPSTKFFWMLLTIIVCMFTPGYLVQYSVFPIIVIFSLLSKNTKKFLSVFMKSIVVIVLFIFIIQTFIIQNEDSQPVWWFFKFSQIGLTSSLLMTSKIVGISSAVIYFFQVTQTKDINYALEKSGVPKKVTFVIASTIQLIPQTSSLSATITDAQKSRGIESEGNLLVRMKSFVPMIGPLVLSSIQQTEERVLTLEARAFSSKSKKTAIYELKKTKMDYLLTTICLFAGVIFVIWGMIL